MDVLNEKIKDIKAEKALKVRPENIRDGINIFGITGNYTGTTPAGTINITQNGLVDVSNYANADVNIPGGQVVLPTGMKFVTATWTSLPEWLTTADASQMITMYQLFQTNEGLHTINLSTWNTSNVANMQRMFYYCHNVRDFDLSGFNTSNVKDMSSMFHECSLASTINMANFNTSNVTNMTNMFYKASSPQFTSIDVSMFNTSKVTSFSMMFHKCSYLTAIDISRFSFENISSAFGLSNMFNGCSYLSQASMSSILTALDTAVNLPADAKTLKIVGFSSSQASTCTALSGWETLANNGWTTGY